jgi:hypothetical protein
MLHRQAQGAWSRLRTDIDILCLRPADRSKRNGISLLDNLPEVNSLANPRAAVCSRKVT